MDGEALGNPVRKSEKESINADFLNDRKGHNDGRGEVAAQNLREREQSAAGGLYRPENGLAGTRKEEDSPRAGFYTGKGSGGGKGKSKFKGKMGGFKKRGPIISIVLAIFGFGGVMMGSQMFQPFSLVAQFQEKFNSMSVSTTVRSSKFLKWQMGDVNNGNVKDPIKMTIFGKEKFKISNKQKAKLAAQGIDYDEKTKVMRFETDEIDVNTGKPKVIEVDAKNFDDVYINNAEFHRAYNSGSRTWRGQFSNWFGSTVINFITNNKLTRNLFADFRQKVDSAPDGVSSLDVFKQTLAEKIDSGETTGGIKKAKEAETEEVKDADGNTKTEYKQDQDGKLVIKSDEDAISAPKTEAEVSGTLDKIKSKFTQGVNYACIAMQFIGTVSILVTAAETLQIVNLATAAFETVDKVKAGYGDESPINELTTALNTKKQSKHLVLTGNNTNITNTDSEFKFNDLEYKEDVGKEKSAMESAGVAALYGNGKVNPNDNSVASFNLTQSLNGILGGIAVAGTSFAGCAVLKLTANAVSAVSDAIEVTACVIGLIGAAFTFGASTAGCSGLIMSTISSIAISAGIALLITGIITVITPKVTEMFTRDLVSNIGGEDFGNALTSGANIYQGSAHRSTGGSLATPEKYTAYLVEQQKAIADQAQYERETLSPFDLTSKYTFMGSIMTQLMGFATNSNTLMGTIKAGSSAISNSVIAMTPTASAYSISDVIPDDMDKYAETCPYLAGIGAVGDAFCNPYITTDISTMETQPIDIVADLESKSQIDVTDDGDISVADGSDLAKYIVYCDNRSSQFGITDQNIANSIGDFAEVNTSSSFFNAASNGAIGAIPVIGDMIDVVNNGAQLANLGYITGESCVAGNTVSDAAAPGWNTAKTYQRFIEDQELAESMGLIEKSAATAYYEKYLEQHPLDNSYEGILARYSGLSKETVAFALDMIWYADYIANYDPTERYAFGAPIVELEEEPMNFDNEYVLASEMKATEEVIYADVRNRSFAV